jgi:hypothetical protein
MQVIGTSKNFLAYWNLLDCDVVRMTGVTPGFKAKPNAHSMCAHESSLHTYRIENGYRITNVTI